jgi:hypothetical protein
VKRPLSTGSPNFSESFGFGRPTLSAKNEFLKSLLIKLIEFNQLLKTWLKIEIGHKKLSMTPKFSIFCAFGFSKN